MYRRGKVIKGLVFLLAIALLAQPVQAYAWSRGRGYDHRGPQHHYPAYGRSSLWLPAAFAALAIGGLTYYYCQGVFYRRQAHSYVVVAPPAGAVVTTIPAGYQPIVINGITYYTNEGIYYQYTPRGYVVVPQPGVVVMPQGAQLNEQEFIVNIPNLRGGYTPVVIRRAGSGFVGPQGEYYAVFPSVEQLRAMYANS